MTGRSTPEWIGKDADTPVPPQVTQAYLQSILSYDPLSGVFLRIAATGPNVVVGSVAGTVKNGYRFIRVLAVKHAAHRLAWLYMTGAWPPDTVDHVNGNPGDNRWSNLRLATRRENMLNKKKYSNNRSGFKGVCWHRASGKWRARIYRDRKVIELGGFDTAEIAAAAYDVAANSLHGEFARPNARTS